MVIAFLGSSMCINTVLKMFCLYELSRVKFSTLIMRNSFSTYMGAWWDLRKSWRMQDSLVHCSSAASLPCPLNANGVLQSLWAPSPQTSKMASRKQRHSFWEPLLKLLPLLGKFFPHILAELIPCHSELSLNVISCQKADQPTPSAHAHSLCHIAPFQSSVWRFSLFAIFLSWFIVCFKLPECKFHKGRDLVSCSQLCSLCLEYWLVHS